MSELLRISIAPMVVRLKMYIETAQENLGKELADQSVRADLLAERQNLCKAISLLEKYNGKWEAIFLRVKGQALQDEEQNYRDFKPEGKAFMHWVDQARGLVDTIEGALGLSELGDAIPQPNQPAQVVQQAPVVHQRHDVTLPPITLPKFSGEPREWPLFWKLFETSVESLQIEDFKKHIYLLGCLPEKSIARRAIDLYPPSDENYPRVVEILKKRFGDEKTMVESLQAELLHLPKPAESVQSLRQFSESIERICHQLLDYGENEQNKFMASTIKSKLPYHLLTQVVEKEMRAGGAFNCTELRRAIASIVEVKEEVQRCTQIFRGEEKPRNFPHHSNEGRANQGRGTPFRFSRPFREERWRPVEGNETGHKAQQQQSPKRCLKCGGKHHYMICYHGDVPIVNTHEQIREGRTFRKKQSSKQRGDFPLSKTLNSKTGVSSREEDKPSESIAFDGKSTVGLSNVTNRSHALFCRAMVIPKHDHQKMIEKPILFDQASQTSYQSDSHFGVKAKIPTEINKVELCCAENCYIHENVKKLTYELAKEILLNDYQCQAGPNRPPKERRPRATASQNWTSRRVYRTMAFVVLMANSLQDLTGAETIAVMAKSEKCIKNATSMRCIVENSATLTTITDHFNYRLISTPHLLASFGARECTV
ncbi:hypothetical protein niasHT_036147 [Heterodera trifolii]|uniref:Uncharacterized protein n=1 Tax=Heterodera trifolii TaxID=157864 RepID=A0ABD2J4J4_9BILA